MALQAIATDMWNYQTVFNFLQLKYLSFEFHLTELYAMIIAVKHVWKQSDQIPPIWWGIWMKEFLQKLITTHNVEHRQLVLFSFDFTWLFHGITTSN